MQRLPQPMKDELAAVIEELLAGELSPGRRYEKLDTGDDLYSVRLSRAYRFVFLLYPDRGSARRRRSPRRCVPTSPERRPPSLVRTIHPFAEDRIIFHHWQ